MLAAADLLVLSSESETASLVVLEGMASGLPIVATDVGGAREAIDDGVEGRLVRPRDTRALADGVLAVIESDDRGAAMGAAGRRRAAADFSSERLVGSVTELYGRLLRESGERA